MFLTGGCQQFTAEQYRATAKQLRHMAQRATLPELRAELG
jgi:hypothetical protein